MHRDDLDMDMVAALEEKLGGKIICVDDVPPEQVTPQVRRAVEEAKMAFMQTMREKLAAGQCIFCSAVMPGWTRGGEAIDGWYEGRDEDGNLIAFRCPNCAAGGICDDE